MSSVQTITAVLTLLAGIGVFLTACSMLSSNLETLGSSKLRDLFASASKSRWLGVGIGALGTAAIQSSGAVTVIVIGFVNASIMSLAQAATVIYGANIGTTITGQIVAWGISGGDTVSTTVIFAGLTGIGAFIVSFAKHYRAKTIGGIICGFGMLFVGLSMMSGAMESFAELDEVRNFLASIQSVLLLVLIGAVLTAIIQSSSVMTSVAITMVVAGLITLDQGIYLTMGSNIGSCVVSVIAGLTGSANAKRASLIHLVFNVAGVVIFLAIGAVMGLVTGGSLSFGSIFGNLFPGMPQVQLAMFHTVFNVVAVLLIMPLTDLLVSFVTGIVPDDEPEPTAKLAAHYIDESYFVTPPIAVQQVKNEIVAMSETAVENFRLSSRMARTLDFSAKPELEAREEELDFINRELARYMSKLMGRQLSKGDRQYISHALHSISDLERVGDYSKHIVEACEALVEAGETFSEDAVAELDALSGMVDGLYAQAMRAYVNNDLIAVENTQQAMSAISMMVVDCSAGHVKRMGEGVCSPDAGAQYLAIVSDVERVAAHFFNVAKTVRGL